MPKQNIEAIYPLSPIQQGILFHCLYAPDSGVYFEQTSCELRGNLDVPAFQRAWEMVIARHATLRTAFVWDQLEKPLQAVGGRVQFPIHHIDWRSSSRAEQQKQIEVFLHDDRRRGFDLHCAPLMRVTLIRLSDAAYYFVWSHHHIVIDGWSSSVLMKDLFSFYQALVRGEDPPAERSRPYSDYIEWLNKQDLEAAEQYWRKQLRGFRAATPLHVNGDGPPLRIAGSYGEAQVSLSEDVTNRLKALAKERRLTLNTVVEGSWALLLSRYSRERDVVFGLTVSGRPAELGGVEQMVGLFINTLPLRVVVREEQDIWSWLTELQQQQAEMQMFEYSPLVDVLGWSEVERGTPLFESILVFENYPVDAALQKQLTEQGAGLRISNLRSIAQTNYALTVVIEPRETLRIRILYERDRIAAETIERVLGQYARLLESVARGEGEHGVQGLSLLSAAEREQVLREWPRARARYEAEDCLQELFERAVARNPEAVAVVYEGRAVGYGELNRRANQLAHSLRAQGVGVEEVVGLYVERSVELVVGVLGILKAGCAYLPLEPSQPAERVQFMLADAHVRLVVTQAKLAETLGEWAPEVQPVRLDDEGLSGQSERNPAVLGSGPNLAYVIYTSGSTGQPKGVMVRHANVVRLFAASAAHYEFGAADVWTLFHSSAFDFSVWELWGALLHGGRLVVVPYWVSRTPAAFWELLRAEQVTVLNQTPSAFRQLQEVNGSADELRLRYVIFGGEALTRADVDWWFRRAGVEAQEPVLVNMYGITETTVHVSYGPVPAEGGIGIGKGLADLEVYLLDEQQQPVGVGVGGELYVGGDGLARGYWQRPELTATRFIPHPYSAEGGARLYRTGDLGRYRADGTIEYLGRVDEQVQIRGFRVELGEIEAVLREQAGVQECAVLALEKEAGEKQLAAYVVGAEGRAAAVGELRQALREKLPDYMIPGVFVAVTELPLTANGKLDRKALLALSSEAVSRDGYEGPRTAIEELLAGIYGEVLDLDAVSRHESFFDLGGHSLLATQVISRVRELFQVELALRSLFERPTVAGLAEAVTEALGAGAGAAAVAGIERADRSATLPLSYAQQRLWFLEQLEPGGHTYNVPVGVRLSGALEVEALRQTLQEVVRRHEVLRTRFAVVDGQPVQVIAEQVELVLVVEELSELGAAEQAAAVAAAGRAEAERGFDLEQGPLLRVRLLRLGAAEHVLLLTMHHIISDGWSMNVLVREVAALYAAYREGQPSPLPELTIQYADFAVWQREWLESGVLAAQLDYWRRQLSGELPVLDIARERVRGLGGSRTSTGARLQLSAELSRLLRELSREEGVTLFMLLLAAWQTLLCRYTGHTDVIVGTDVANRTRLETEGLIGFFVNQLVLRTDLSGDPNFRELLARVRAVCIGAYAHQDVPFEKLVEELQPHRQLSRSPLFQVKFVLQNMPSETLELSDLKLSTIAPESNNAKLDLSFLIIDGPDGISGALEYNRKLFDAETISTMLGHFETLLKSIVANPEARLKRLDLLTEAEKEQQALSETQQDELALKKLIVARRRSVKLSLQN